MRGLSAGNATDAMFMSPPVKRTNGKPVISIDLLRRVRDNPGLIQGGFGPNTPLSVLASSSSTPPHPLARVKKLILEYAGRRGTSHHELRCTRLLAAIAWTRHQFTQPYVPDIGEVRRDLKQNLMRACREGMDVEALTENLLELWQDNANGGKSPEFSQAHVQLTSEVLAMLGTRVKTKKFLDSLVESSTAPHEQIGSGCDEFYRYALYAWEKVARQGEAGIREQIRGQILSMRDGELYFSKMELRSLPLLPDHCTKLYVVGCRLGPLPPFSERLTRFALVGNQLSEIPTLPASLKECTLNGNQLAVLPDLPASTRMLGMMLAISREFNYLVSEFIAFPALPPNLEHLEIHCTPLTGLPLLPASLRKLFINIKGDELTALTTLPANLEVLTIHGEQLTLPTLPESIGFLEINCERLTGLSLLPASLSKLDIRGGELTTLPPLPVSLEVLKIHFNPLTELPPLPVSLRKLDIQNGELTTLPPLPAGLHTLRLRDCRLTTLPPLPAGLYTLCVDDCDLTALPLLPAGLYELNVRDCELTTLPPLPAGLHTLRLRDCRLTTLPPLPAGLYTLCVDDCDLTALPLLPAGLYELNVRDCELMLLPPLLPGSLRFISLQNNRLTSLPESVFSLPPECSVNIEGNSISETVLQRMMEITSAPGYNGPQIRFSMDLDSDNDLSMDSGDEGFQARALHEAVADWFNSSDQVQEEEWRKLGTEPGAEAFSRFLDRLGQSVNFKDNPEGKAAVAKRLSKVAGDSKLRALTFEITKGSTASCEDRVALVYNSLTNLFDAHDVSGGAYDGRLDALAKLGRSAFRVDALEKISRRKAQSLRLVDEIEVYLAYRVQLRERLGLHTGLAKMKFFRVSGVGQKDLDDAVTEVQMREQAEFPQYFLVEWAPWEAMLTRLDANWRERENAMLTDMLPNFEQEVNMKLAESGFSEEDNDARIQLGAAVMKEHQLKARVQISRGVLGARGEEAFLDGIIGTSRSSDVSNADGPG
ncbi:MULTISPECIES: NEL-type E3 ubiquitin ligase domain-containing protein [unclassified Herbaspirillum]|uniref:NEL-type E3 ubiquitin ligase domain-containing protein n=1 Tax=unclassified Herbaspirillum TaxID=2624150 RepID=UPI00161525E6|nr:MULTISPECIES: NEL-type E3 ubiquitin ligase domain-containing protein [unclassified Herbaspirillum]MBB5391273.1 Leucine-rich repeat (LRR) protein [Herbaspirillum sp. SJZ102]